MQQKRQQQQQPNRSSLQPQNLLALQQQQILQIQQARAAKRQRSTSSATSSNHSHVSAGPTNQHTAQQQVVAASNIHKRQSIRPSVKDSLGLFGGNGEGALLDASFLQQGNDQGLLLDGIDDLEPISVSLPNNGSSNNVSAGTTNLLSAGHCNLFQPATQAPGGNDTTADDESLSLLHNSCKHFPTTISVVQSALSMDPQAIRRRVPTACGSNETSSTSSTSKRRRSGTSKMLEATYCYPINIAIASEASAEILKLLIQAGPDVLNLADGPEQSNTLFLALSRMLRDKQESREAAVGGDSSNDALVDWIVRASPQTLQSRDKHKNTPLHHVLRYSKTPLSLAQRLYMLSDKSILQTPNFNNQTPLDIAVRNEGLDEQIVNFLQSQEYGSAEAKATEHLEAL